MSITMYGADWCGDCIRAKRWFADNNVEYDYVNLEEVPDAADIVLERNNGLKRIPVIVFADDSHLTEPSNEALAAKVAELGGDACEVPSFEVIDNAEAGRFELQRDGKVVSTASYSLRGDTVVVPHVGTDPEHRGQGYAGKLMDGVLDKIRLNDQQIAPLCPFAARHIRDNPEHHDLVAPR